MKTKSFILAAIILGATAFSLSSCQKEDLKPAEPLSNHAVYDPGTTTVGGHSIPEQHTVQPL